MTSQAPALLSQGSASEEYISTAALLTLQAE